MKFELRGCGTALVSPFDVRGRIDFGALERLVEWQIKEGADFLVTCTPTGESPTLSGDERRALTAKVVKIANGRLPVVAGAGGNHTAKSVFWARAAEDAGADAVISVTPAYNQPTAEGLIKHFSAIGEAMGLPLVLYNVPARTGSDLNVETILRLVRLPRVAAFVEASGNFFKISELLARLPAGLSVLSGDDLTALAGLGLGMTGLVSAAANEVPGPMAKLVGDALENRWDEARSVLRKHLPLLEMNLLESSPGPIKAALAMMGKCGDTLRLPLAPVREETSRTIEKTLKSLRLIGKKAR